MPRPPSGQPESTQRPKGAPSRQPKPSIAAQQRNCYPAGRKIRDGHEAGLTMQPFWDVLWSDTMALAKFVVPMLVLSLPTSTLGALVGTITSGSLRPGNLRLAMSRGTLF